MKEGYAILIYVSNVFPSRSFFTNLFHQIQDGKYTIVNRNKLPPLQKAFNDKTYNSQGMIAVIIVFRQQRFLQGIH